MNFEKQRKLAFAGNVGAIGFISGMTIAAGLNGNLNIVNGSIFIGLILANVICAITQW